MKNQVCHSVPTKQGGMCGEWQIKYTIDRRRSKLDFPLLLPKADDVDLISNNTFCSHYGQEKALAGKEPVKVAKILFFKKHLGMGRVSSVVPTSKIAEKEESDRY